MGKDFHSQFEKEPYSEVDSLGTPYDYRSVMHYDKTAFGSGKLTIYTKQQYYQNLIGTGPGFSSTDVKQINLMYGCPVNHHSFPQQQLQIATMLRLPVRLLPQKENVTTEAGKHTCTANANSRVVFAEDQLLHVRIRQDHALRRHALEPVKTITKGVKSGPTEVSVT